MLLPGATQQAARLRVGGVPRQEPGIEGGKTIAGCVLIAGAINDNQRPWPT